MAYNYEYPYVDSGRVNADWLINQVKYLMESWEAYVPTHQIKFLGDFDYRKKYEPFSIVVFQDIAYLSIKDVPEHMDIFNQEYWIPCMQLHTWNYDASDEALILG